MKDLFRVGDKVYSARHGWGCVVSVRNEDYPFVVEFEAESEMYTRDGGAYENEPPSLSFTEYDYINGGFSQERPKGGFLKFGNLDFLSGFRATTTIKVVDEETIGISQDNKGSIQLDRYSAETLHTYLTTILEK